MASKTTQEGFQLLLEELKANKGAAYADLKAKAEKKGLTVYPVMFGRAKAMLGLVRSAKRGEGKAARASQARANSAAPRRGGGSKSDRIRELLRTGMSPADIAKKVGCSVNLVYVVKSKSGAGAARGPRTRSRRGGPATSNGTLEGIVAALREGERERERLRRTLERIRTLVGALV